MDNGNRPHSRQKTVGNGSASVNKGQKVNTGARPVGAGGRTGGGFSGRRAAPTGQSNQGSAPVMRLNLKSILILALVIIVALFLIRSCGGSAFSVDDGSYGSTAWNNSSSGSSSASSSGSWGESSNSWSGTSTYSGVGSAYTGSSTSSTTASYTTPDRTVSELARDKYYTPLGNGQDTVTIMVYMCGTDLESKYSMATKDLNEMLNANLSDKVNLIVETGGCSKWQNNLVSSQCNQIYKLGYKSMTAVEKDFGNAAMTDPENLARFIRYCKDNYPADRNILIFWDHGGGSLSGYGYDEKKPNASSMTLSKINSALNKAGAQFDFIGFDACLMATLETDMVCSSYADYLIASEETEPGTGWYYTNWLSMLSENTSAPTVDIAQRIIDDFVDASCSASPSAQVTLSVVDLAEMDGTIPDTLREFATSTNAMVSSDSYQQISDARAGARQFSQKNKLNQVDLIDMAQRVGTVEANALAEALHGCVKYNKTTISRSHGISIYFPYENTRTVKNAIASYNDIGMDEEYTRCIQSFASLEYGGQIVGSASQQMSGSSADWSSLLGSLVTSNATGSSSTSPVSVLSGTYPSAGGSGAAASASSAGYSIDPSAIISLLSGFSGRSMPIEYDWVDTDLIAQKAETISQQFMDPSRITATIRDGRKVLNLTDEEWKLIQTVELNVFANDGEGYIDLGLDNTFEWLSDNELLLEYDGTWLTLNGNVCAYYLVSDTQVSDGNWVTVGRIPARLNGRFVNLQVVFDEENPQGTVTGAYPMYENEGIDVQSKGDIAITPGDSIELLCDFYTPNGDYSSTYTLGDSFRVPQDGLKLVNLQISTQGVRVMYRLTDIYGNHFWVSAD